MVQHKISTIHHINRMWGGGGGHQLIMSPDAEKAFDKNLTPFHDLKKKRKRKLGLEGNFLNIRKGICGSGTIV